MASSPGVWVGTTTTQGRRAAPVSQRQSAERQSGADTRVRQQLPQLDDAKLLRDKWTGPWVADSIAQQGQKQIEIKNRERTSLGGVGVTVAREARRSPTPGGGQIFPINKESRPTVGFSRTIDGSHRQRCRRRRLRSCGSARSHCDIRYHAIRRDSLERHQKRQESCPHQCWTSRSLDNFYVTVEFLRATRKQATPETEESSTQPKKNPPPPTLTRQQALLLYPISHPLDRPADDGRETVTRRVYHYLQPHCSARYCYCTCRDWEECKRGKI